jgi:hypothetical protein
MAVPKGTRVGGRQKGTPNKATAEIKDVARKFGPAAIKKAAELAGLIQGKEPAQSEAAQVSALNIVLERAYGKASQPVDGDGEGGPIAVVTKVLLVGPGS